MKKLLSALLIIAAAANTYGEIKKSFSLNAETNLQYDGNILYPDSITGEASFISTTTFKPSLLLQPDKMSMFKISATASYTEQFKPIDHLLTTGLNLQYKRFLSSRSMVGALVTGSLSESNNSLLDERFVSGEVQGGRYLSPYTNLAGKLTGSLKNYPGLFKIDNGTNNYFYNFFDIKPQLALTAEHTENLSCKYELTGFYRNYYDDNHTNEYIDYVRTDSIDHIDLNGDGSFDTVYVLKGIPTANVTKERDIGLRATASADYMAKDWLFFNITIDGMWQESNDPYYISRELNTSFAAEAQNGKNTLILTLSYGLAYFPERGIDIYETTPFAGIILRRVISKNFFAEFNGAYRQVNNTNNLLDYSKPVVSFKLVWKK